MRLILDWSLAHLRGGGWGFEAPIAVCHCCAHLVRRVFFFAFVGFGVFIALEVAGGPAEVSTQADDLKERLNDVRVSDFSREADEKVAIIERALSSANHGQGVGFQVVGTVIDQRKLQQIGMRLVAGAQVFVPLVLAFSVYGVDDAAPSSGTTERGDGQECSALSAIQVAPLAAWHQMMNSTCAYNLTIGPDGVAVH